ncbi:MAG TPA: ferredoxin--NADP reductase [Phycisphaerae bacterium]|jgi:ferredoxin--NADP+ reductase|nr:ferredoxin--NADP reductase [Phycisphaerae bacterium]HPM24119.1 ferredoxin--NADP reductase [Phycisphaerae bacterium]
MEADPTNATLVAREDLTDILSIVRVRPDSGTVPPFTPGQFLRLGLPRPPAPDGAASRPTAKPGRIRLTRRAYSIASSPLVTETVEFFVVRVEAGELTPRLWEIGPGDRLWMDTEAKGEFSIDLAPPDRDLVMISTGTGIAPFLSMLRTYRGQNRWRRFVLINGVRFSPDLGYRAEMETIAREDPTVVYIPLATREPADSPWVGRRGRVQTVLEPDTYHALVGAPLDPAQCHVFLCGNPDMIDAVQKLLEDRGFVTDDRTTRGNLHFERYW